MAITVQSMRAGAVAAALCLCGCSESPTGATTERIAPPPEEIQIAEPRRLIFADDFSGPYAETNFPSEPVASMNFWTDDGVRQLRADPARRQAIAENEDEASWRNELGFLSRDLRASGELRPGEFLTDPYLKYNADMLWGEDANGELGYAVRILDDQNNGYLGEVRRNGDVFLYRIDRGEATRLKTSTEGLAGRGRQLLFSVEDGEISLTDTLGLGPITAEDHTHDTFTQVGFGGRVWEEKVRILDVEVYGRVTGGPSAGEGPIAWRVTSEIEHSIFGSGAHFPGWSDYRDVLPLMEQTGLKWLRASIGWFRVEQEKGAMRIPPRNREWIDDAHARGFNISFVLAYRNQFYPMNDFPAFRDGFARYCAFMAETLKDRVQVWEIWNEPSNFYMRPAYGGSWNAKEGAETPWLQRYVDLIIASARAIREVHPEAVIIAGDVNYPVNYHMLDLLEERGAVDLLDGLVLHVYNFRLPPEVQPWGGPRMNERDGVVVVDDDHSYASALRRIREKMAAVGMKNTDLYITETGYTSTLNGEDSGRRLQLGMSLETQAKYLARTFLLNKAYDVKVSIQYNFVNDSMRYGIGHQERGFGLVRGEEVDYEKKPAWHAVRNICSLFSGPVEAWTPDWTVAVDPPAYPASSGQKVISQHVVWDGEIIEPLNRVTSYTFRNDETGEVLLVLWNAVGASQRSPLLTDVTLDTDAYRAFDAVDLLTGKDILLSIRRIPGQTVFKKLAVPDYPIAIRMRSRPGNPSRPGP